MAWVGFGGTGSGVRRDGGEVRVGDDGWRGRGDVEAGGTGLGPEM